MNTGNLIAESHRKDYQNIKIPPINLLNVETVKYLMMQFPFLIKINDQQNSNKVHYE